MASPSIKSTYTLDVDTIRKLERLAARWRVPKSEVLRRAIDKAAREDTAISATPLDALKKLQQSIHLTSKELEVWAGESRRERLASSRKREWRRK